MDCSPSTYSSSPPLPIPLPRTEADAAVSPAGQLAARGTADDAVLGGLPVLVLHAVLHLRWAGRQAAEAVKAVAGTWSGRPRH